MPRARGFRRPTVGRIHRRVTGPSPARRRSSRAASALRLVEHERDAVEIDDGDDRHRVAAAVPSQCASNSARNTSSRLRRRDLLLRREQAAGPDGDNSMRPSNASRSCCRPSRGVPGEAVGQRRPACTVCTARTTRPRGTVTRLAPTAAMSVGVVEDHEAAAPRPLPIACLPARSSAGVSR